MLLDVVDSLLSLMLKKIPFFLQINILIIGSFLLLKKCAKAYENITGSFCPKIGTKINKCNLLYYFP
jgi:hypothetical protein